MGPKPPPWLNPNTGKPKPGHPDDPKPITKPKPK